MRTRVKRIKFPLNENIWGVFTETNNQDFRIVVPTLSSEFSYKINIHEYAHAYELFLKLQEEKNIANIDIKKSEEFAKSKEEDYELKKQYY